MRIFASLLNWAPVSQLREAVEQAVHVQRQVHGAGDRLLEELREDGVHVVVDDAPRAEDKVPARKAQVELHHILW